LRWGLRGEGANKYCTRTFARLQNQDSAGFIATEEAEAGMAEMSKLYDETGRELYMGAGDRERD
jgi:phosphomethylpyrimidine synthase